MKRLEFMAALPANDNRNDRQRDLFAQPQRILVGMDWETGREVEVLGHDLDGLLVIHEVLAPDGVKIEAA